jgi:PAS domain S-box-containing protein
LKNYKAFVNKILIVYFLSGISWVAISWVLSGKLASAFSPLNFLIYSFLVFIPLSSCFIFYFFKNLLTTLPDSDIKKKEEKPEFEKNNQRLIEIIENTSDLVAIATIEGKGVYLNKAGAKMMEADDSNTQQVRNFSDCHPPHVQEIIMKEAIPYAMKHGSWVGETSFISRTGKIIPTSQVVIVHKSPEGKPEYISTISRDISRGKEAAKALAEAAKINQIFYKSLANSPLAMMFWSYKDGKSKVLDWNNAATKILGYAAEEAIGRDFFDFLAPGRAKEARPLVDLVVSTMTSRNFISPSVSKNGKKGILNWFATPVKDPLSDNIYILSLAEDITQKMDTEAALREKEQRWMLVVNGNNDGIYDWNIKTGEIFFSDRYKEILGFQPHEGPNTVEEAGAMIHPDDIEMVSKMALDYLAKKIPEYKSEHRERCKDGSYKWVLNRGLAVWDNEGNPLRMVGSHTDITERKKTEEHLRMIESVVLSINDGVAITKMTSDVNLKPVIIYINKSFTKKTGYTSEEVVGRVPGFLTGAKTNLAILDEAFENIKNKTGSYKNEIIVYRKDGSHLWIEFSIDPILDETSEIRYWVWVLRDITKRKEAEEELKKINFELDSFVYRASHDLRAPLTSIIGLVNISSNEQDIAVIRNYFKMISESAKKLDRYIINLLSLSRNSRLEVSNEEINFEEIIKETFDELRYMKNAELLKLIYNIEKQAIFYSDSLRLKVIFKNLLSNAIKYQNTNSERSFLRIDISIYEKHAELRLDDNGIGIPEKIRDKIFDMFFRGTELSDGSGLGLYIVKNVLEKMNGTIHIDSNEHKGSTIVIKIPNNKNLE